MALPAATDGPIAAVAQRISSQLQADESALWLLPTSRDAFLSRLGLIDTATTSLDIQYFLWQDDWSGQFLLERLLQAADRGVRVRLLIDDVAEFSRDAMMFGVSRHPNIEVKIFNPWRTRTRMPRAAEWVFRVDTLNHRLHNKTIIADGLFAMIGGRNVGDRYFGVYEKFVQHDLDILFSGALVGPVESDFDNYWRAGLSVPIQRYLKPRRGPLSLAELRLMFGETIIEGERLAQAYDTSATSSEQWIQSLDRDFSVGKGRYIFDDPDVRTVRPEQVGEELLEFLATTQRELIIVTAYFVPSDELMQILESLAARGVRIVLLTNSIQTNNHMLAHVGYKRWRKRLLRMGIELFEAKPDAALMSSHTVGGTTPEFLGLHSKAIVIDDRWSLVGTPNLDPRALKINTENAVIVDSIDLARRLKTLILEAAVPENAWRIQFDARGQLVWSDDEQQLKREPKNGFGQRIKEFLFSLLPIKNQA